MVFEIIKSVVRPVENLRHVAYLLPHTDVTAEMDCARMLPGHVIHVQRMWLDDVGEEAERRMVAEELPAALRYLKGVAPYGCAVFGCTSASAANGREGMLAIERQMRRELSCPSITALGGGSEGNRQARGPVRRGADPLYRGGECLFQRDAGAIWCEGFFYRWNGPVL